MLQIDIIPCLKDNYSYLLHDKESNMVAIIDPSEFEPCDKIINQKFKKLDFILNTHHHAVDSYNYLLSMGLYQFEALSY